MNPSQADLILYAKLSSWLAQTTMSFENVSVFIGHTQDGIKGLTHPYCTEVYPLFS